MAEIITREVVTVDGDVAILKRQIEERLSLSELHERLQKIRQIRQIRVTQLNQIVQKEQVFINEIMKQILETESAIKALGGKIHYE